MCLGIPGKIVEIIPNDLGMATGKVAFGGVIREVCLAFTPEVEVGDYVLVHVGFAMSRIDEQHAQDIFDALALLEEELPGEGERQEEGPDDGERQGEVAAGAGHALR